MWDDPDRQPSAAAITPHHVYDMVEADEAQDARERATYAGLADAVRRLCDASVRSTVDDDVMRSVTSALHAEAERLEAERIEGSYGVALTTTGHGRAFGNAVVGLRNPVAVPLEIERDPSGRAWASFHLGAVYEGPPGLVHGGVTALLLDQICGEAASAGGSPGMTGTLNLRYLAGTPLGPCSAEAWIDRTEGVKTFVKGAMRNAAGEDTVSAEGIFILPKWARAARDEGAGAPNAFE